MIKTLLNSLICRCRFQSGVWTSQTDLNAPSRSMNVAAESVNVSVSSDAVMEVNLDPLLFGPFPVSTPSAASLMSNNLWAVCVCVCVCVCVSI